MAPLAQLSWGLGRLGGGEARAFRFVHVEGESRWWTAEGEPGKALFKPPFSDLAVWP